MNKLLAFILYNTICIFYMINIINGLRIYYIPRKINIRKQYLRYKQPEMVQPKMVQPEMVQPKMVQPKMVQQEDIIIEDIEYNDNEIIEKHLNASTGYYLRGKLYKY